MVPKDISGNFIKKTRSCNKWRIRHECDHINETEGEPDEILKNTDTYPFMADYRLVIVNNSGLFAPRSAGKDEPEKRKKS